MMQVGVEVHKTLLGALIRLSGKGNGRKSIDLLALVAVADQIFDAEVNAGAWLL